MGGNVKHAMTEGGIGPSSRRQKTGSHDESESTVLYCPYCGRNGVRPEDNYCSHCGEKLTGTFK